MPTIPTIELAREKAERILREHLDDTQQMCLDVNGWFDVQRGERAYRIHRGRFGNIDVLVGSEVIEHLCVHPIEDIPDADTMLAQKLSIEMDEQALLKLANHLPSWVGPRAVRREATPLRSQSRGGILEHTLETPEGREALANAILGALRYAPKGRDGAVSETIAGAPGRTFDARLETAERLVCCMTVADTGKATRLVARWLRFVHHQMMQPRAA